MTHIFGIKVYFNYDARELQENIKIGWEAFDKEIYCQYIDNLLGDVNKINFIEKVSHNDSFLFKMLY
ncbi:hypothetical protein RO3G_14205 [Rhizopus delemar RA 99-880]|uniref:Uncharacterized protein n=1 Tax=Rhizopus delemar (strain RA 99-880 / ATCC MYA-4621 / FGSC 9543 / NRRL 43880) TaxID=246409 RepID=I1CM14_RHIO9|nr:hypothetical protein RO3G_14205 [Rhizopus delemar RA 99-880]|eukprot:EIE89494.1 hypothetical protein RO3G_14205 [Rhizopus delemar RA 99-880]